MTFGVRVWGSTSYKAGTAKDTVKSLKFARYKFHMIVFADISLQSSFFFYDTSTQHWSYSAKEIFRSVLKFNYMQNNSPMRYSV